MIYDMIIVDHTIIMVSSFMPPYFHGFPPGFSENLQDGTAMAIPMAAHTASNLPMSVDSTQLSFGLYRAAGRSHGRIPGSTGIASKISVSDPWPPSYSIKTYKNHLDVTLAWQLNVKNDGFNHLVVAFF